jgi:hypothetical protein
MFVGDFRNQVLIAPAQQGADRLCIVSGYATPSMAAWHMQKLKDSGIPPIHIDLIVGMCPVDGLSMISHKGFQDIIATYNPIPYYPQFNCQYVYQGAGVHSKLYVWLKNDQPVSAFIGSANYTLTAFSRKRREVLNQCDPVEAISYFDTIEGDTVYCTNAEVEEHIRMYRENPALDCESAEHAEAHPENEKATLSLLSRSGEVGTRSGLNWGQRDRREPNQAYISLPASIARSDFFPLNKQHFTVITDDNKSLVLRVEQQNDKAITTPENNSRIGEYFRNRLGLANGSPVWRADLERYGRTDITFYKYDDEQYFMDFSIQ